MRIVVQSGWYTFLSVACLTRYNVRGRDELHAAYAVEARLSQWLEPPEVPPRTTAVVPYAHVPEAWENRPAIIYTDTTKATVWQVVRCGDLHGIRKQGVFLLRLNTYDANGREEYALFVLQYRATYAHAQYVQGRLASCRHWQQHRRSFQGSWRGFEPAPTPHGIGDSANRV